MTTDSPIRLERIRVKDLHKFATEFFANAEGQKIAPISPQRALAQSRNPYADEEGIGLIVAYDGSKCVGYRGILPGLLMFHGATSKVYWASSLYVLPEYRQRKIGRLLVNEWLALGRDAAATGSTDAAGAVYEKARFRVAGPLKYLAIKLEELNIATALFHRLQRIAGGRKWMKSLATAGIDFTNKVVAPVALGVFYRMVMRRSQRALRHTRWVEVQTVRPLADKAQSRGPRFMRGAEVINWMLQSKWFKEKSAPCVPLYYFSDTRDVFRYAAVELHGANEKSKGFMVLSVSKTADRFVLKLLDWQVADQSLMESIFWITCRYAATFRVRRIELPLEYSAWAQRLPCAGRVVTVTDRRYYFHPTSDESPLAQAMDSVELSFCDSDLAFF